VAALIAPRPLCICSGRKDGDFPPDGYHEVFAEPKKVYDLYAGAAGNSARSGKWTTTSVTATRPFSQGSAAVDESLAEG